MACSRFKKKLLRFAEHFTSYALIYLLVCLVMQFQVENIAELKHKPIIKHALIFNRITDSLHKVQTQTFSLKTNVLTFT